MKLWRQRNESGDYVCLVHLDESRTVEWDGGEWADPEWTAEYVFGAEPPEGVSRAGYEERMVDEVKLLADAELAARRPAPMPADAVEEIAL